MRPQREHSAPGLGIGMPDWTLYLAGAVSLTATTCALIILWLMS
jgi:hypothetical protein